MDFKTGAKHTLINAILKISARMLHYGSLPPDDRLHRHILDVRANMNLDLKLMDPNVARGMRTDWLSRERLNLSHNDIDLLRSELGKSTKHKNSSWSQDRSIYMRSVLKSLRRYSFFDVVPQTWFLVLENRTFAGRLAPLQGEAEGRDIAVAWFEAVEGLICTSRWPLGQIHL